MKKILAMLLIICVSVLSLPLNVLAEEVRSASIASEANDALSYELSETSVDEGEVVTSTVVSTEYAESQGITEAEDTMTIYFQNNWSLSDVRVYFWNSDTYENPEWPGYPMTFYEYDGSYDVYTAEVPVDIGGLIFNGILSDGSGSMVQTTDIIGGWEDNLCYYMMSANPYALNSYDTILTYLESVEFPDPSGDEDEGYEGIYNPDEAEYIYYSDLFYGYSHYLKNSTYLRDYHYDTQNIIYKVYDDYMNSARFEWSLVKDSLKTVFDLKEYVKIVSDSFGLTSFTYNNALDAANVDFAQQLLGNFEVADAYGTEAKYVKRLNDILKVYDKFDEAYDVSVMTETEIFTAMFAVLKDSGVLINISHTTITTIQNDILPDISKITGALSKGGDALTAAKVIATGLVMEDLRLEIIDDIISAQTSSGTMLYDGMTRLKNQLKNGFASYFLENYLTEKVLNELADKVVKEISKAALGDSVKKFNLIGAITKVGSWIVFDCIFNVPDIDDLTKQMVLRGYSMDLYALVQSKIDTFNSPFEANDVLEFESIFTAYVAATNAALQASKKICLKSNVDYLAFVIYKYEDADIYFRTIESAKALVDNTPVDERVVTNFGTWVINSDTTIVNSSDTIEEGYIYVPATGIKATVYSSYRTLTIPMDADVVICGDVQFGGKLNNNGKLTISGNLDNISKGDFSNSGELEIFGNLSFGRNGYYHSIEQKEKNAIIKIGGNFDMRCKGKDYCQITAGKVVFNGTEQQTVENLKAYDVEVTNPKGIKYLSNVYIHGEYKLNGNTLDNNGYSTYIYNGFSNDQVSDYKSICLMDYIVFTEDIMLTRLYSDYCGLSIPMGVEVVVDGDVQFGGDLNNKGKLIITGNLDNISRGDFSNSGELEIFGNLSFTFDGYFHSIEQKEKNAVIKIGRNFEMYKKDSCQITDGKIIINGAEQQEVKNLKAPVIVLENESEAGVVFTSSIAPSVLFNHKGNKFTLYNSGTGSSFVDYDGDGLKDNVDPEPTVGNPCVLYFESQDVEKGSVSIDMVETIGGTEVTVTATPTFKYEFSKWINSSGKTVSTKAENTFVASGDETYTAVFIKRSQPITKVCEGGKINAPSKAEIESEVAVTVSENAGYIYTEGSLCCNGVAIENGTFVMPDEPVTLTAEFIRNEHYFALSEKLAEAKAIKYTAYSAESFAVLKDAITAANSALVNHVTEEESQENITALQTAIDNLKDRYVVSISVSTIPVVYVGVEDMINNLRLKLVYDNSTTAITDEYTIGNFNVWQLGEQEITVSYGELSTTTTITVEQRLFSDVSCSEVTSQLYSGAGTYCEPDVVLSYSYTADVLSKGEDYIITYENNDKSGTATMVITGTGNYNGTKSIEFEIYCEHTYDNGICSICGLVCEHTYADGKCSICGLVCEHTYTDGECTICGLIASKFAGASITLGGNLGVNFGFELSEDIIEDENARVVFTLPNGTKQTVFVKDATVTENGYYVFTCEVNAIQMSSIITAQVVATDYESEVICYSVVEYAVHLLSEAENGNAEYAKYVPLVKAMLNYGAYSQVHFGYATDNLANNSLADEDKMLENVSLLAYKPTVTGKASGVRHHGSSLTLDSETAINLYFVVEDEENMPEFYVNGVAATPVKTSDGCRIEIEDIPAQNLDDEYVVTVGDLTVKYSAFSYGYSAMYMNDENVKNVIRALYAYNQAAEILLNIEN